MWRLLGSVAVMVAGVVGVYWLMVLDAHFLILATLGATCGGLAGRIASGWRGALSGAAVGFLLPLAYIPMWFAFDLPPHTDIDL